MSNVGNMSSVKVKNIQPLFDRVWIEPEKVDEKTAGGLYLPDQTRDQQKSQLGTIRAAGPGKFQDGQLVQTSVRPGDRVLFMQYRGQESKIDGVDYVILAESDILAVVKE